MSVKQTINVNPIQSILAGASKSPIPKDAEEQLQKIENVVKAKPKAPKKAEPKRPSFAALKDSLISAAKKEFGATQALTTLKQLVYQDI